MMDFADTEKNYYEILEISTDASHEEIRSAYQRAKSAYKKDSVALYSLLSEDESIELLRQIEIAYRILADADRRAEYDKKIGIVAANHDPFGNPMTTRSDDADQDENAEVDNVISIDRVPPMEDVGSDDAFLVAPSTDFTSSNRKSRDDRREAPRFEPTPANSSARFNPILETGATERRPAMESVTPARPTEPQRIAAFSHSNEGVDGSDHANTSRIAAANASAQAEILAETEWKGGFIRKIREARGVPLEELSEYTKIGKTYLIAIEEENFSKLPAPVYLRGFLVQIGKYLKLPPEAMAKAYLLRLANWQSSDKAKLRA